MYTKYKRSMAGAWALGTDVWRGSRGCTTAALLRISRRHAPERIWAHYRCMSSVAQLSSDAAHGGSSGRVCSTSWRWKFGHRACLAQRRLNGSSASSQFTQALEELAVVAPVVVYETRRLDVLPATGVTPNGKLMDGPWEARSNGRPASRG